MAIQNVSIADNGHLMIVLEDGTVKDAGNVRGVPGPQGEKGLGIKGDPGEPGPAGAGVGATIVQTSIILGATFTAPVTGARTAQRLESQQVGDKLRLTYKLGFAAGQPGSGHYLLSLPTGVTFNTAYHTLHNGAEWFGDTHGQATNLIPAVGGIVIPGDWTMGVYVVPYDATRFRLLCTNSTNTRAFYYWGSGFYFAGANTSLNLQFEIWK